MQNNEYTNIELEIAKAREAKRAKRKRQEAIATTITLEESIDADLFQSRLDSMTIVEETAAVTRYSSMPVIEFELSPVELKAKRKLLKAIKRADKSVENIKAKIPSHKERKRCDLEAFQQKLNSLGNVEVPACDIEFKEIGM